ncbi:MAG: manganese/iron ABC transporter ATP-binding protein [Rhodobiaceae bacterium]|nr:manganese/iron ABC transporter ATP-binding protein [Rhodobiaceae bacterium]MCC0053362.1 manganese/iron ABC transporter ATP-binding protein [Rhodobiaceae bacterium]
MNDIATSPQPARDAAASAAEVPGVDVRDVRVTYPNGVTALEDVSFSLPAGAICGLVGINGSGKSTLFKALMGFVGVSEGSVSLMGLDVREALKRNLVAYVPQNEDVDWNFPVLVEDVVMMGRYGHMNMLRIARKRDHEAVTDALRRVGMEAFRKRQIGELSGGQKKRVFVARALAQEARVILLDEPFTGVDVKTENAIIDLLRKLGAEGCVLLVSTHNLGSVPTFCDQVVLINRTVLASGPTAEVFTPANLEKAFSGVLRRFTLEGEALHDDDDPRALTVLTDDERPLVLYGEEEDLAGLPPRGDADKADGGKGKART